MLWNKPYQTHKIDYKKNETRVQSSIFSSKQCIGIGGYSTVYKVELPTGWIVAVQKLHSSEDGYIYDWFESFQKQDSCFHTDKASQYRQVLWLQFICRELIFGLSLWKREASETF